MTIYLSLIRQTTRIQKQFPLSVFFFIDSVVASAYKTPVAIYAISCQNNLELHLGYHTCWLSYFTLVCLWCRRTVGRAVCRCTVKWLPNFLGWLDYFIFFTHGVLLARFARESSALSIQSTPDNSNLQGKSKKVRVIGNSKKIAGSKEKNRFYCIVNILITFNCRNVKWKLKDTSRL